MSQSMDELSDAEWQLVTRNLAGIASADEVEQFHHWCRADERRAALVAELEQTIADARALPSAPKPWDVDARWRELVERMRSHDQLTLVSTTAALPSAGQSARDRRAALRPSSCARRWSGAVRRAAVIVLAAALGTTAWALAGRHGRSGAGRRERAEQQVATKRGERARISLADGTRIVLDAESVLRYAVDERSDRRVILEGRAYFDVVHDPIHPFVVQTGAVRVEDVGTSFVVRAYPGDSALQVVVSAGRVVVHEDTPGAERHISAGEHERVTLVPNGSAQIDRVPDVDRYLGWTDGRLVFVDAPLSEVASEVSRAFDVRISAPDAIAARRLTATIDGESLEQVLDLITLSLGVRYTRTGREIHFFDGAHR